MFDHEITFLHFSATEISDSIISNFLRCSVYFRVYGVCSEYISVTAFDSRICTSALVCLAFPPAGLQVGTAPGLDVPLRLRELSTRSKFEHPQTRSVTKTWYNILENNSVKFWQIFINIDKKWRIWYSIAKSYSCKDCKVSFQMFWRHVSHFWG